MSLFTNVLVASLLGASTAATSVTPGVCPYNPEYLLTSSLGQVLTGDVGGVWSNNITPDTQDVALVLGPTGIPQPSDEYLQSAYNLYLNPSGLYDGPSSSVYSLYTPELSGNTETGLEADEQYITAALMPLLNSGHIVTLFGYSQSSAAISDVLNQITAEYGNQYADQINFVMVGNSASPHGLLANLYDSLPSWAQQFVLQVAQSWGLGGGVMSLGEDNPSTLLTPDSPYHGDVFTLASGGSDNPYSDGFASWSPDSFANGSNLWFEQMMGMFSTHQEYMGVTPDDVTQALSQVDPSATVNYLDLDPGQSMIELLTQAAAGVGWISQDWADALLSIGL